MGPVSSMSYMQGKTFIESLSGALPQAALYCVLWEFVHDMVIMHHDGWQQLQLC
jgi:hypothetical protein